MRHVSAEESRTVAQCKNGTCLIDNSDGSIQVSGELALPPIFCLFEHGVQKF